MKAFINICVVVILSICFITNISSQPCTHQFSFADSNHVESNIYTYDANDGSGLTIQVQGYSITGVTVGLLDLVTNLVNGVFDLLNNLLLGTSTASGGISVDSAHYVQFDMAPYLYGNSYFTIVGPGNMAVYVSDTPGGSLVSQSYYFSSPTTSFTYTLQYRYVSITSTISTSPVQITKLTVTCLPTVQPTMIPTIQSQSNGLVSDLFISKAPSIKPTFMPTIMSYSPINIPPVPPSLGNNNALPPPRSSSPSLNLSPPPPPRPSVSNGPPPPPTTTTTTTTPSQTGHTPISPPYTMPSYEPTIEPTHNPTTVGYGLVSKCVPSPVYNITSMTASFDVNHRLTNGQKNDIEGVRGRIAFILALQCILYGQYTVYPVQIVINSLTQDKTNQRMLSTTSIQSYQHLVVTSPRLIQQNNNNNNNNNNNRQMKRQKKRQNMSKRQVLQIDDKTINILDDLDKYIDIYSDISTITSSNRIASSSLSTDRLEYQSYTINEEEIPILTVEYTVKFSFPLSSDPSSPDYYSSMTTNYNGLSYQLTQSIANGNFIAALREYCGGNSNCFQNVLSNLPPDIMSPILNTPTPTSPPAPISQFSYLQEQLSATTFSHYNMNIYILCIGITVFLIICMIIFTYYMIYRYHRIKKEIKDQEEAALEAIRNKRKPYTDIHAKSPEKKNEKVSSYISPISRIKESLNMWNPRSKSKSQYSQHTEDMNDDEGSTADNRMDTSQDLSDSYTYNPYHPRKSRERETSSMLPTYNSNRYSTSSNLDTTQRFSIFKRNRNQKSTYNRYDKGRESMMPKTASNSSLNDDLSNTTRASTFINQKLFQMTQNFISAIPNIPNQTYYYFSTQGNLSSPDSGDSRPSAADYDEIESSEVSSTASPPQGHYKKQPSGRS